MAGYISEFQVYGSSSHEFIEVALPEGTDPSGWTIYIYDDDGTIKESFSFGSSTETTDGQDVYVVDSSTPGFSTGASGGNFHGGDAVALVDGDGNIVQYLSYFGNSVVATKGPADGMSSTDLGPTGPNESFQSDDGGSSYYRQSSPNSGTIPACYAPGSLIATPDGPRPIEALRVGDLVYAATGGVQRIRWIWSGNQPLEDVGLSEKPVLIRKGAMGSDLPAQDLIVSAQHRIVVGAHGQLEDVFDAPWMVPAMALIGLRGVRFMAGKRAITWHHFLCDDHTVIFANGLASETLLLGSMIVRMLNRNQLVELSRSLGRPVTRSTIDHPALSCLSVGETKRILERGGCRSGTARTSTERADCRLLV